MTTVVFSSTICVIAGLAAYLSRDATNAALNGFSCGVWFVLALDAWSNRS